MLSAGSFVSSMMAAGKNAGSIFGTVKEAGAGASKSFFRW